MIKKTFALVSLLTIGSFAAPSIISVDFKSDMVTVKDNTVYGKVSYFLDADGNDSVNVSVAIYPEGLTDPVGIGFESLKLKTEGDVGLIHTRGKKQEMIIWFTTPGGVVNLKKRIQAVDRRPHS